MEDENIRRKDESMPSMEAADAMPLKWYEALWRVLRPVAIWAASLTIVIGVVAGGVSYVKENYLLPVDAQSQSYMEFTIPSGASVTRVGNLLEEQGLIRSRSLFKYFVELMNKNRSIRAGTFVLSPSMSMQDILFIITQNDGRAKVRDITIVPGMTVEDVAAYLVREGVLADATEFLDICRTGEGFEKYYLVQEALDNPAEGRKYVLEGYLAPDTYEIYVDSSAKTIISKLVMQTDVVFSASRYDRLTELNLTAEEVLILASIVEREAKNADFAKVSAVLHNRLQSDMALQVDSTLQYVLGTSKLVLSESELAVDSRYNSYKIKGYPPSPISNPSRAAIQAVLYPDAAYLSRAALSKVGYEASSFVAGYYYFCTMDPETGGLYFSKTLQEHERAVAEYRPLWVAYDNR